MKKALIFYGGWDGHTPKETSELFAEILKQEGFEVVLTDSMQIFDDYENIKQFDLLVPNVTMSEIDEKHLNTISNAIIDGIGIAGCHGGMCDSFRQSTVWQFITGGQWVEHPGGDGVEYEVEFVDGSEFGEGLNNFVVKSEQYYMHIDPAVTVHATTTFPTVKGPHDTNGVVKMPVVYTKKWGKGNVFYCSLGHTYEVFNVKEAKEIMRRGFLWAAR